MAIIAAVAAIIFGIKSTNEEILSGVSQEAPSVEPSASVFVANQNAPGTEEEAVEVPERVQPKTDRPEPGLAPAPAPDPAPAPVPVPEASLPVPEPAPEPVTEVSVPTRDFKAEAAQLREEVAEIFEIADAGDAASLATSDFVRGSALKSAGDQAFDDGTYEQALSLYERSRETLAKAAFGAAVARFEQAVDEAGLAGLRETPTARWIQIEGNVELARADLEAGRFVEGIQKIQNLNDSIPSLKEETLASWMASAAEAAKKDQKEVAVRLYRKILKADPENEEAKEYLFTNAYEPGTVVENSIGMKFAYVPPGTFVMGTPESEAFRDNDEVQHKVTLTRGFFIGVHEVTQEQWRVVMNEPLTARVDDKKFFGPLLPAHSVSWEGAVEFCRRLSDREGRRYRLPTEAEWEYAARAGTTTPYNTGGINLTTKDANVYDPSGGGPGAPLPVGAAGEPNAYGLYDMHGNVWEWVADWAGPYPEGPVTNPKGMPETELPSLDLAMRSVRGGSYIDDAAMARSGNRWEYSPAAASEFIGFRIVLEVDSF